MAVRIRPVDAGSIEDLGELFGTDRAAAGCWCMWFIASVKDYHAAGSVGNRAAFCELLAASDQPMGLIAYSDEEPAGWCARPRASQRSVAPSRSRRFPMRGPERRRKETQVGLEAVFARCGFAAIGRPFARRVVMRLDLSGQLR